MNTACFLSIPASMYPDQEILVFNQKRFTYSQLEERVNRLAGALRSLGLGKGSRVGVLQTNCNEYIEAYYATSKLGGIFVPLNYRAKVEELKHMINTAQVETLFIGERYADLAQAVRADTPSVRHRIMLGGQHKEMLSFDDVIAAAPVDDSDEELDGNETNIMMFTSGTTSLPKAVLLGYQNFVDYIFGTVAPPDGSASEATLLCAPLYHIAGISAIMTSVYGGRRLVLMSQFDSKEWLRLVKQERITNAFLVPTMLKRLLDDPDFANSDLSTLQILSYGAAPMPLPVIRRAIEVLPKHIGFINAFGQTETTATVAMLLPEDHRLEGSPEEIEKKLKRLGSIGRPLPDVELRILNEDYEEVPVGEIGEIALRTSRLMKGYAGQEELTREAIVDGWIRTRDLGWLDEEGYVFLAGRKDDLIIRGGENIAPAEIELVLQSHPDIEEAAVIGCPDEEWGEKILAVVVMKQDAALSVEDIQEYCRGRLASFKKPEIIEFAETLPRNALGKMLKKELKTQFASRT